MEDNMGYKILDVKADIHEDVEEYLRGLPMNYCGEEQVEEVLNIVDKHFEKIER